MVGSQAQRPPVELGCHTKLALQPQDEPLTMPVPFAVGQAKQKAAEPVPTRMKLVGQTQACWAGVQIIVFETQLQLKELSLVVVKAAAFAQVKQT